MKEDHDEDCQQNPDDRREKAENLVVNEFLSQIRQGRSSRMLVFLRIVHAAADYAEEENGQPRVRFHVIRRPVSSALLEVRSGEVAGEDRDDFED